MSGFGTVGKEVIDYFGKQISFGVLFEVVDDPEDDSKYFPHLKPIDVWLIPLQEKVEVKPEDLESFKKNAECVRNITKVTPPNRGSGRFQQPMMAAGCM